MCKNIKYVFIASMIFSSTAANPQNYKQAVPLAKEIFEYQEQLQATKDIVTATTTYGPEPVYNLCLAAYTSLSPSTFSIQRIFPFIGKSRDTMVKQCLTDFCASGGNHTSFSETATALYCVKN